MKHLPTIPLALLPPALAAGALLVTACGGGEPAGWSRVEPDAMSETQRRQQERAQAAQRTLGSTLMGELSSALEQGGPEHAIGVCREVAGEIAARAAAQHDLRIGRTSHRLRNPENAPPPWAEPWVERRVEEPVWLEHGDGRLAGLAPIRAADLCVRCHGPREELDPGVRAALDEAYPRDEATGFAAGDLRGWFWMEVPPPSGP